MNRKNILLLSGVLVAIIIAWQMSAAMYKPTSKSLMHPEPISKTNPKQILAQTGVFYVLSLISKHKP